MYVIDANDVNDAFMQGVTALLQHGVDRVSRAGPVLVFPGPVTTVYRRPKQRVLMLPERDANPFFHFYESLWMIDGRNDVASVAQYAKNMRSFSDDGKTFHGAYGFRWRKWFGGDQLEVIAETLRENSDDRRCVLGMWDPEKDLGHQGKDFPCNTQAYFSRRPDGALDMTVCNRSNDIIWGAYGANAVHFSALQEFMAGWIGCEVGTYWQISNNFHAYRSVLDKFVLRSSAREATMEDFDPYTERRMLTFPMVNTPIEVWQQDLKMMLDENVVVGLRDPFFRRVAVPILKAHQHYRENVGEQRYVGASEIIEQCLADDWRAACREWIHRRYENWKRKADDGTHDE